MRLLALVIALAGCGGAAQYGDFVRDEPKVEAAIAADAANKLAADVSPDTHILHIAYDADDEFGRDLTAALRKGGYAVSEGADPSAHGRIRVQFVLDKIKGTD